MKISTRKLQATDTRGERIKATVAMRDRMQDKPAEITWAWDYGSNHPHRDAAESLARVLYGAGELEIRETGWTATGYNFDITYV